MKFGILGQKFELTSKRFLIGVIAIFAYSTLFSFVGILNIVEPDIALITPFYGTLESIGRIIGPISEPITAFILLTVAGLFKQKKDGDLVRSLAVVFIVLMIFLQLSEWFCMQNLFTINECFTVNDIVFIPLLLNIGGIGFPIFATGSFVAFIIDFATGGIPVFLYHTVLIYLWMRLIVELDKNRLKNAAQHAIVFATVFFFIIIATNFCISSYYESSYALQLGYYSFILILSDFLFAVPLLYFLPFNEIKRVTVYAFAIAYVCLPLQSILGFIELNEGLPLYLEKIPSGFLVSIIEMLLNLIALGIICLMASHMKNKKDGK